MMKKKTFLVFPVSYFVNIVPVNTLIRKNDINTFLDGLTVSLQQVQLIITYTLAGYFPSCQKMLVLWVIVFACFSTKHVRSKTTNLIY